MRYKEYNRNAVLEKAISLFWKGGFRACSINDMVEATQVNRFSLYKEFENKEGILYASLELYRERDLDEKLKLLQENGELKEVLFHFFKSFRELNRFGHQGCYFIHIGTEMADEDDRIRKLIGDFISELNDLFRNKLVQNGVEEQEVIAKQLVGLFCTSTSFSLIQTEQEQDEHLMGGINTLLSKTEIHA